jgi:hypothetical protein
MKYTEHTSNYTEHTSDVLPMMFIELPGSTTWDDQVSAYGAGNCRFESCRGHLTNASIWPRPSSDWAMTILPTGSVDITLLVSWETLCLGGPSAILVLDSWDILFECPEITCAYVKAIVAHAILTAKACVCRNHVECNSITKTLFEYTCLQPHSCFCQC